MSIFLGRQCAFVFPIYVRKYRKQTIDRWIVVYTVCASAVITPLRQRLDSYAKTRLKMCHTFKYLFICNTFCCRLILLSLSLYIELALVCCANPNNVNCFGTIFPNLNFVFASIWAARPVHIESDQYRSCSTVKPLRIRHRHLASTLFHSLVPWRRPRRIRPQITRLSQLENSAMGTWPIYKNSIIPDWFEKWRDIKF